MVVNEIRKNVEAAVGKLSPKRAQELASSLMPDQGKDQIAKAAQNIMEWSNRSRERLSELVRAEVRSQLNQLGVASRDELDALRRRVRELEKSQTGPKRSAAKRTRAKRPAAKRSTPEASTAEGGMDPSTPAGPTEASPSIPVVISGPAPDSV